MNVRRGTTANRIPQVYQVNMSKYFCVGILFLPERLGVKSSWAALSDLFLFGVLLILPWTELVSEGRTFAGNCFVPTALVIVEGGSHLILGWRVGTCVAKVGCPGGSSWGSITETDTSAGKEPGHIPQFPPGPGGVIWAA